MSNVEYNWLMEPFDEIVTLRSRLRAFLSWRITSTIWIRQKGLRRDALRHLEDLLSTLKALLQERQRRLASLLCWETISRKWRHGPVCHKALNEALGYMDLKRKEEFILRLANGFLCPGV